MRTSARIDQIAAALSKAQSTMEAAKKESVNPFFHSRYAGLAEVWDTCRKPLTDNGLCFVQSIASAQEEGSLTIQVPTKNKAGDIVGSHEVPCIWLTVTSRLLHTSEQWFEDSVSIPVEADPQSIGKNTTYIRRYAMMALCGVAPEDDDGEAAREHKEHASIVLNIPSTPSNLSYFCPEHNTVWFKKGKMTSFAHPIGDTGEWCHMHTGKVGPDEVPMEPTPMTPTEFTEECKRRGYTSQRQMLETLQVDAKGLARMGYTEALKRLPDLIIPSTEETAESEEVIK